MINDNIKGWLYVLIQFLIIILTVVSAYAEKHLLNYRYNPWAIGLGALFFTSGVIFAIASVISFRQAITPHPIPLKRSKLRTTGMYKLVRHPIYFSVLVIMIGVVFSLESFISLIFVIVLFFLLRHKAFFEEIHLNSKFPEYAAYKLKTKMLIPFIY